MRFYENSDVNYNYDILKIIYEKINNEDLINYINENIYSSDILLINTLIHDNNINNKKIIDYEDIKNKIEKINEKSLFIKIYNGDIKYLISYFNSNISDIQNIDKKLLNIIINLYNNKDIINRICNYINTHINDNKLEDKENIIIDNKIIRDEDYIKEFKKKEFILIDIKDLKDLYLKKLMTGLNNCYLFEKKDNYYIFVILNNNILKTINKINDTSYFVSE
jgi:hypothetical protein